MRGELARQPDWLEVEVVSPTVEGNKVRPTAPFTVPASRVTGGRDGAKDLHAHARTDRPRHSVATAVLASPESFRFPREALGAAEWILEHLPRLRRGRGRQEGKSVRAPRVGPWDECELPERRFLFRFVIVVVEENGMDIQIEDVDLQPLVCRVWGSGADRADPGTQQDAVKTGRFAFAALLQGDVLVEDLGRAVGQACVAARYRWFCRFRRCAGRGAGAGSWR